MNKISNIMWGIVLVAIGVILALNSIGVTSINIFFRGWWTLFIIVPCFIDLFKNEDKTGNIIGIIIGLFLLLACRNILSFVLVWKLIVPVILVIVGLSLIFKDAFKKEIKESIKKLNKDKKDNEYYATFGGSDLNFDGEEFKGADLSAVFGGIKCNLRSAKIKNDVVVNATSIFGGITLLVPNDVNIKVVSTSIFGGVDNKKSKIKETNEKTIYVNATCLFGGVEIK